MIFAIYRGVSGKEDKEPGQFTKGRLYIGEPEIDDKVVVDVDKVRMTDDKGERVWIEPGTGRFEYPEEVYAVVVEPLGAKQAGEVVVVDAADEDGYLSVKGMGYVAARFLQLLDWTMLRPGMMVYDKSKTRWDRVRRVDECMRVCVEADDEMRECTEFIFAVSDGDLTWMPLLKCLDDTGQPNLKTDSIYRVKGLDDDGMLLVEDDTGKDVAFEPGRFEFV